MFLWRMCCCYTPPDFQDYSNLEDSCDITPLLPNNTLDVFYKEKIQHLEAEILLLQYTITDQKKLLQKSKKKLPQYKNCYIDNKCEHVKCELTSLVEKRKNLEIEIVQNNTEFNLFIVRFNKLKEHITKQDIIIASHELNDKENACNINSHINEYVILEKKYEKIKKENIKLTENIEKYKENILEIDDDYKMILHKKNKLAETIKSKNRYIRNLEDDTDKSNPAFYK